MTSTPLPTVSEQVRVRPTLILALGELGGRVLQGVRRRLLELFGSLDEFPIVGFCWLNAEGANQPEPMHDVPALRLRRGEVFHLESALLREDAGLSQAFSPAGDPQAGRVHGQALFRAHDREIRAFLREAHTRIRDPLLGDRLLQSEAIRQLGMIPHISFSDKAQVFVVGAVSEADTSGMFLELAEMLTQVFPVGSLDTTAVAVLDYHPHGQAVEFGQAHAYAFLRELEATFQLSDEGLTHSSLLLENCYLVEYQHKPEMVEESLIDVLFSNLSEGEFGDHKRSARINLRQNYRKHFSHNDGLYQQRFYSGFASLGLGTFGIPHHTIVNEGAHGLAAEAVLEWLGPVPKGHEVTEFLRNHLLDHLPVFEDKIHKREDIITALLNKGARGGEDEDDLLRGLGAWHEETMAGFRPRLRSDTGRAFLESLSEIIRGFEVRQLWLQGSDYDSSSAGALLIRLRRNAERWRRAAYAQIEREIFNLVDERGYGISFARAVLVDIAQIVQNSRAVLEERAERHAWLVYQGSEQIARLQAELSRSLARGNWDGRRHLILEHVLDKYLAQHSGQHNVNGAFLNTILKHACKQGVLACSQLVDELIGRARGDGTRVGGLLARLDRLLQQLEQLALGLREVGDQRPGKPLWPLQHPLDYYCRLYWPDAGQRSSMFSGILRSMSLTFRTMITDLDHVQVHALRQSLLQQGRRALGAVRDDYHVLRFLYRECTPAERERFLRGWVRQSEPRLALRQRGAAAWPHVEGVALVGIPLAPTGCSAAERNELEGYAESLRQWLHNEYSQNLSVYRTPDGGRLEFYQETGGFPLQALTNLDGWRQAYHRYLDEGWDLHLRASSRSLAEIAPLDQLHLQGLEEACEVLLVGELVGLIGYTDGDYIYWDVQGCWRTPHPLGAHRHGAQFLSRAPRLRQQLLQRCRTLASDLLNSPNPEHVAEFAARLERTKRRLQGPAAGELPFRPNLEFQIQVHVLRLYAGRIQECSAVRGMSIELFSAHVERLLHAEALQPS